MKFKKALLEIFSEYLSLPIFWLIIILFLGGFYFIINWLPEGLIKFILLISYTLMIYSYGNWNGRDKLLDDGWIKEWRKLQTTEVREFNIHIESHEKGYKSVLDIAIISTIIFWVCLICRYTNDFFNFLYR